MKNILENTIYRADLKRALINLDISCLNNKSILITGGLGLICSTIVDLLHEYNSLNNANIKIYVADLNRPFFKIRYGAYNDILFVDYNALEPIRFDISFDYIIHGAGLSSPELFMQKPVETMLSNINGVLNLLEYSKIKKVKRMLYISSSEVYGNKTNSDPFLEDSFGASTINSIRSSYSESKRASEVLCISYSSEFNVDSVIVRPGHIYGPTASPKDQRVSSAFAFLAADNKPLIMKSDGLTMRSYCYSIDCASAILTVLIKGKTGEAYNIGHNQATSIRRMAEIVASAGGVPLEICCPTKEEVKAFNPMQNSCLDCKKIMGLGYKDTFTVEEGLTDTVFILRDTYFK